MRLITRQLAEGHLKRSIASSSPPSNDEVDMLAKIEQAEAFVIDFVNQRRLDSDIWAAEVEAWNIEDPNAQPPEQVKATTLRVLKCLDRFRGDDDAVSYKEIDDILRNGLGRLRDPAIA